MEVDLTWFRKNSSVGRADDESAIKKKKKRKKEETPIRRNTRFGGR